MKLTMPAIQTPVTIDLPCKSGKCVGTHPVTGRPTPHPTTHTGTQIGSEIIVKCSGCGAIKRLRGGR